jgi:hypothetical protein
MPSIRNPIQIFRPRTQNRNALKRTELRESLWPGSAEMIWSRKTNDGFTSIPRLLPLVMLLIKSLSEKGDPSRVYLELWTRAYDEGIVTIGNENDCAFAAGCLGTRALRTWHEHIFTLQELGFIKVRAQGNREIGHILLLDPLRICCEKQKRDPKQIPDGWWGAFVSRANEIGAKLTPVSEKKLG